MLKNICPNCEKVTNIEYVTEETQKETQIDRRSDQFFHCLECDEEFDDPESRINIPAMNHKNYSELMKHMDNQYPHPLLHLIEADSDSEKDDNIIKDDRSTLLFSIQPCEMGR